MALDRIPQEEVAEAQNTVSSEDVEIVTRMGIKLLMEGDGMKVIEQSVRQSKDPAQVIGQFLAQMIGQLAEQLAGKIDLDPRVFLAKGGFLENILNFIEKKLGLPAEFSDNVWSEVVEVIKAAANNPNDVRPAAPGAPIEQQAAPVMGPPQGGM